jgi:hypothetical protein
LTLVDGCVTLVNVLVRSSERGFRRPGIFSGLPRLARGGFVLLVAGGLMDTAYHVTTPRRGLLEWFGTGGHFVTLLGMLVTMAGVFSVGLRKRHP